MSDNILIVSHADGDGHLIAEQVRRNLSLIDRYTVEVLVDPKRTQGHQIWQKLDEITEINNADVIFFTDLMFSPSNFVQQAEALRTFCQNNPNKRFFAIDHHPMPNSRLEAAANLRVIYRPEVFECAFGPRSGMMVVAAICEHQGKLLANAKQAHHELIAKGVQRAAAINSPLCGGPLMALLSSSRWDLLAEIGREESGLHRSVRGRRVVNGPRSNAFEAAEAAAKASSSRAVNEANRKLETMEIGRVAMAYDVDIERIDNRFDEPPSVNIAPVAAKDLETLVTLLEVAAISLTTSPEATFAIEELIEEAKAFAGPGIIIDEDDVKIVLKKARFLRPADGQRLRVR